MSWDVEEHDSICVHGLQREAEVVTLVNGPREPIIPSPLCSATNRHVQQLYNKQFGDVRAAGDDDVIAFVWSINVRSVRLARVL